MTETEQQLLNRIDRMYGIRAPDETVTSSTDAQRELQRLQSIVLQTPPDRKAFNRNDRTGRATFDSHGYSVAVTKYNQDQANIGQRVTDQEALVQRLRSTRPQDEEADANKAALEAILGGQRQAAVGEGTATLNSRFGNTWRQSQQRLGSAGLAGGSADLGQRRRMLADLFKGRANLALAGDTATRAARNSIDSRRMELQRQVKLGTSPNLDALNAVGEQRGAIDEAYKGLGQQAVGDLFSNAGNVYYGSQEAAGMGRAGPSAFTKNLTRRPSTTGTYY